jgi:outer membrane protein TolC
MSSFAASDGAAIVPRHSGPRSALVGRLAALAAAVALVAGPAAATAQPAPLERVTFDEAIRRALERNPSSAIAAAGILRADALLAEARSVIRPQIAGAAVVNTLNRGVEFEGTTVTPVSSFTGTIDVRMPVYAPAAWARRTQAEDQRGVAGLSAAETRRQTAIATADAFLSVIARRRVIEENTRARDVARAHFDLAAELEQRGSGSRLNRLRAQQELSTVEGVVDAARLALYRAQEALGVLLMADGPVDAADEPDFTLPAGADRPASLLTRADLQLFSAEARAAERVLNDSAKDRLPYVEGLFQPSTTYPGQFFVPSNSWRLVVQASVPLFDSGFRASQRLARQADVDASRATLAGATTRASAEVRSARESVASAERVLASARAAADQASQVVSIVNVSFRAGAATNIEVIDAERSARDAATAAVVAEDLLRRARLDLLTALGQFP